MAALNLVLAAYQPFPAVVIDRAWNLVAGNRSIALLTDGVADRLLAPPANVLRVSLHPDGLAPRIANLPQWRAHVLHRLAREAHLTADSGLAALHRELAALPTVRDLRAVPGIAPLQGPAAGVRAVGSGGARSQRTSNSLNAAPPESCA